MSITSANRSGVIWITGLSGAGKTSLANAVCKRLREKYKHVVRVDGDVVRELCGNDLGYSLDERLRNAYRISRFCKFLHDEGLYVICSTMSLYPEIWAWNRANIGSYREVYVKVSWDELVRRDQKGLYSASERGLKNDVVGIGQDVNEPTEPDLVVYNDCTDSFGDNVEKILQLIDEGEG
jgi:adenylylsulfate kinase-like enzyme